MTVARAYDRTMRGHPGLRPATREFFAPDVLEVAPRILGCVLTRTDHDGTVALRITEVEAYAGNRDPGAHSFRGKTARNATMFGEPGHLYCYFTYGLHHALNLVAGAVGEPYGCLIRAGEVIEGADLARRRRERNPRIHPLPEQRLGRGPGCVAQCFDANLRNDGDDLFGTGEWEFFAPSEDLILPHARGPRVGVSGPGGDGNAFPWRYWLPESSSVSSYKPGRSQAAAAHPI